MIKPRTFATWYDDSLGTERDISIEVEADGLRDIAICTDLPVMDSDQEERIKERLSELYWAAERHGYELSQDAQEELGYRERDSE